MASVNKAILVGNLGHDPETKYLPSGDAVCNFSIATSEKYNDKSGEQQEITTWHNICTFKKTAEICGQYLSKGSSVYLEGKIRTRKWQDKDGHDRYTTEIVADRVQFLGGKGEKPQQDDTPQKPAQTNQAQPKTVGAFDDMTDDIPF